jgi:hypothetical protein
VKEDLKESLKEIPKLIFLIDEDSTIKNDFAIATIRRLNIAENNIVMYVNDDAEKKVLHRDLPMRIIDASKKENPHIDDLLEKLESFLGSMN